MIAADSSTRLRPASMFVDDGRCIDCGMCEEVAPGMLADPGRVPVNTHTLEAMSVCPTGAIRWLEGKEDA